jgi:Uma2 family endonuclease
MPLALRRFTVEEYDRMAEAGVFHEDDRVELVHGQVVQMTPIGPGHAGCVGALDRLLTQRVGDAALVWVQNPLLLGRHDEPQPDLLLLQTRPDGYRKAHPTPTDVLLVIEVADTSLRYERETKLRLYAAAGIPEAWLVALPLDRIEVCTEPGPDGYRRVRELGRGERLRPVMLPSVEIGADEVLGPPSE